MISLSRPKITVKPCIKGTPRRVRPKASMDPLGLVFSTIAIYSTFQWYDARLKRTRAEGKPMWPWEEK